PRLSDGWSRVALWLRQDHTGAAYGSGQRGHSGDRGSRGPDVEWTVARSQTGFGDRRAQAVRSVSNGSRDRGAVVRNRERNLAERGSLHRDGDSIHDDQLGRSARYDADRVRQYSRAGFTAAHDGRTERPAGG